jgi:hypothetical protein
MGKLLQNGDMSKEEDHLDQVILGVYEQLSDVFENSAQSIYIYLDDKHKVCNGKFAALLGYATPNEWAAVGENFPDAFVSKDSQKTLISAYQASMEKFVGSVNNISWKTKTGRDVRTSTILVPIVYEGHAMALHFVSQM